MHGTIKPRHCYAEIITRNGYPYCKQRANRWTFNTLFLATEPLARVSIDVLVPLLKPNKRQHSVIGSNGSFFEVVRNRALTYQNSTRRYGSIHKTLGFSVLVPKQKPSPITGNNTARFFTNASCILGISNVYTITDHPPTNAQSERFNRTLLSTLHYYVADHLRTRDKFTHALTYADNP